MLQFELSLGIDLITVSKYLKVNSSGINSQGYITMYHKTWGEELNFIVWTTRLVSVAEEYILAHGFSQTSAAPPHGSLVRPF